MTEYATAPTHDGPPPCELDVLEMQLCRAKARNAELEAGLAELVDASQMANICDPRLDSALYEARELLEADDA